MSRRKPHRKSNSGRLVVIAIVTVAVILSGLVLWQRSQQGTSDAGTTAGTTLKDSDTAFSIPTRVSQPAPKFTAIGVDGEPYSVTPGDGRPKAIVFYMGFQ